MKIIAGMATIPPRHKVLQRAVASLVRQVDVLYLHFSAFNEVPGWVKQYKNVEVVTSTVTRLFDATAKFWYADSAKYIGLTKEEFGPDDVYFSTDDDITYPPDYTEKMIAFMETRRGDAVCVHGSRLQEPIVSYHKSLRRFRFAEELVEPQQVHVGGTGTMAIRPAEIPLTIETMFGYPNMADIWMALHIRELGKSIWSIPRKTRWLRPLTVDKGVFELRGRGWDFVETALLKEASPWPAL